MGFDVTDQSGRRWSYPNQGAVLRANPDGSDFEVFAAGIRNLQEFAFDEYGNLISVDNDGDHPGETERLVYLTEGSDSGWRANWQYGKYTDPDNNRYNVWMDEGMFKPRFDGQAAHITPPIAPYHAGPAGMVYDPGTALSDEWRNHFFVASFQGSAANARIYAFRLKPEGAGFALERDTVLLHGHPDGRHEVRPGWRALSGRLDDGAGTRKTRDESGRWIRPRRRLSAVRHDVRSLLRAELRRARRGRSRPAAAASRQARAAEGPVRAGPPRRRHDAPACRAPGGSPARADPRPVGHRAAGSKGSAALGAAHGVPGRHRSRDPCASRQVDRRRA